MEKINLRLSIGQCSVMCWMDYRESLSDKDRSELQHLKENVLYDQKIYGMEMYRRASKEAEKYVQYWRALNDKDKRDDYACRIMDDKDQEYRRLDAEWVRQQEQLWERDDDFYESEDDEFAVTQEDIEYMREYVSMFEAVFSLRCHQIECIEKTREHKAFSENLYDSVSEEKLSPIIHIAAKWDEVLPVLVRSVERMIGQYLSDERPSSLDMTFFIGELALDSIDDEECKIIAEIDAKLAELDRALHDRLDLKGMKRRYSVERWGIDWVTTDSYLPPSSPPSFVKGEDGEYYLDISNMTLDDQLPFGGETTSTKLRQHGLATTDG